VQNKKGPDETCGLGSLALGKYEEKYYQRMATLLAITHFEEVTNKLINTIAVI
jgi:hypothetical protein